MTHSGCNDDARRGTHLLLELQIEVGWIGLRLHLLGFALYLWRCLRWHDHLPMAIPYLFYKAHAIACVDGAVLYIYIYIYIRTVIYIYNLFSAVRQTPASQLCQAAAAAQPPQYMTLQTDRSVVVRSPLCRSFFIACGSCFIAFRSFIIASGSYFVAFGRFALDSML